MSAWPYLAVLVSDQSGALGSASWICITYLMLSHPVARADVSMQICLAMRSATKLCASGWQLPVQTMLEEGRSPHAPR